MTDAAVTPEFVEPSAAGAPAWEALPAGEWAIIELFGHTTLIGKIEEVERFGAKMLALQPLFNGHLLDPVYHGGAAIYRLTPCSRAIAWEKQPKHDWQLPPSIRVVVPPAALPAPEPVEPVFGETDPDE